MFRKVRYKEDSDSDVTYMVRNKIVCESCGRKAMRNPWERIRQLVFFLADEFRMRVLRARFMNWAFEYDFDLGQYGGHSTDCDLCGKLIRGSCFHEHESHTDCLRVEHEMPAPEQSDEICERHDWIVCDHLPARVWLFCRRCPVTMDLTPCCSYP